MIDPPSDWPGCHLKFFSSDLAWTWWMMIDFPPRFWHLVEILEILLLYVLCYDACKFATNLFSSISWEPFENVNLLYFLLWMQIWNGCNALNIAGNSIKDINAKLTFLSSRIKSWKMIDNPFLVLTSGGNLGNSTFACTLQWCMQIFHKPFPHQLRVIWKC